MSWNFWKFRSIVSLQIHGGGAYAPRSHRDCTAPSLISVLRAWFKCHFPFRVPLNSKTENPGKCPTLWKILCSDPHCVRTACLHCVRTATCTPPWIQMLQNSIFCGFFHEGKKKVGKSSQGYISFKPPFSK